MNNSQTSTKYKKHPTSSELGYRLVEHKAEVLRVLASAKIQNPAVFGSVARGTDTAISDIDLLVDIPDDLGLFGLAKVEAELSVILNTRVELTPRELLKPETLATAIQDLAYLY